MQKIIPHLWFDKEAVEAAEFYSNVFPNSKINFKTQIKDTPSGDCDIVGFSLMGFEFQAISAGPLFKLNPSISFMVNFDPSQNPGAEKQIDEVWKQLEPGGKVLMPLGEYPFSKHYGWVEDKFGVSWQLILTNPEGEKRPTIMPSFLFVGDVCGKAKEATDFYLSVFKNSKKGALVPYGENPQNENPEHIMFTDFKLEDTWMVAMDSSMDHQFQFNEAVSFIIQCKDQDEIDYFWDKLSAIPEAEQCGWVKDQFGVSWQIIPENMAKLTSTPEAVQAMLKMKKINIEELKQLKNK